MRRVLGMLTCLGALWLWTPVHAANGVAVESKTVAPGDTSVHVGIHIENDVGVVGIVIPLEIRSIDSSAFITNRFALTIQGRLSPWEEGSCFKVVRYIGTPPGTGGSERCSMKKRSSRAPADTAVDFVSPDVLMYCCVGVDPAAIRPGDDGTAGKGKPSLLLTFDVTGTPGRFEIDTTCVPPANHIMFVGDREVFDGGAVHLSYFHKGVIEISPR